MQGIVLPAILPGLVYHYTIRVLSRVAMASVPCYVGIFSSWRRPRAIVVATPSGVEYFCSPPGISLMGRTKG